MQVLQAHRLGIEVKNIFLLLLLQILGLGVGSPLLELLVVLNEFTNYLLGSSLLLHFLYILSVKLLSLFQRVYLFIALFDFLVFIPVVFLVFLDL